MVSEDLKRIRQQLKERAVALRNRGQYDRAIEALDQALSEIRGLKPEGAAEERAVRAEMADTYGMKGGVYRRAGNFARALEQYRYGAREEEKDRLSTYNASNVITLEIIVEKRSPVEAGLQSKVDGVIEQLEGDTRGARQDEWWAWFDLGQFHLLRGHAKQALRCYEQAIATGPRSDDIERHAQIMEDLRAATASTAPAISREIASAIEFVRSHID